MQQIRAWFEHHFDRITNSIAFWPTLLALLFLLLAISMRSFSTKALFKAVDELMPFLLVRDRDVSLSLLTTLIGGLISMMVFSFSMVMVLLSNATSNLSPRLLPSLIGSRRHQVVLGFYLGTILYCIIIAMGFGLGTEEGRPPSTSLSLAIIFGIICLGLFIYFIHGVSLSIQVNVVLRDTHEQTRNSVEELLNKQAELKHLPPLPQPTALVEIQSWQDGFFRGVDAKSLAAFAKTHELQFVIDLVPGTYVLKGDPLLNVVKQQGAEKPLAGDKLHSLVFFENTANAKGYYGYGVQMIVEVALKALSPGINDPGTAVLAIDYLRQIFCMAAALKPVLATADKDGAVRVWQKLEPWQDLLSRQLESIETYGKNDPMTQRALAQLRAAIARVQLRANP